MSLIDRKQIEAGVLNMFRANMGLRPGEKILVVSDPPALGNWSGVTERITSDSRACMTLATGPVLPGMRASGAPHR